MVVGIVPFDDICMDFGTQAEYVIGKPLGSQGNRRFDI